MLEEIEDVWSTLQPTESINISWFKEHKYTPKEVKLFLEGAVVIPDEENELGKHRINETITGTPIYVNWFRHTTAFADDKGFLHYAIGTAIAWKSQKYIFIDEAFIGGLLATQYYWVYENSREAETIKKFREHIT